MKSNLINTLKEGQKVFADVKVEIINKLFTFSLNESLKKSKGGTPF